MTQNIYPLIARAVVPLLLLSLVSNLSILISPLFMMQVLDRVIPSGNIATLALLGLLALAALILHAFVDAARDLSLGRLSRWTEREGTALALAPGSSEQDIIVSNVAGFSKFLGGPAAIAAIGAPWIPIFLFVLWMLHPAFLLLLVLMAGIFIFSKTATDALGRSSRQNAAQAMGQQEATLREVAEAEKNIGISSLVQHLRLRFAEVQRVRHRHEDQGEIYGATHSTVVSLTRSAGQIGALALGAWLVTAGQLSAGGMIAGSIITSKAYMAVESLLVSLPAIRAAKKDYLNLSALSPGSKSNTSTIETPSGALRVENLIFPRGGGAPPRLDRIAFELHPSECLAIVGNSGSGKSTLLDALRGSAPAPIGSVFLGDNEVRSLSADAVFAITGYVPQRAILRTGTIAENICSFVPNADPSAIIAAAKTAGVHGLICALPNSYETDVAQEPYLLSAGQMQRVALARAIYANPKYLFLDEPNALLDSEGERALGQALIRLKKQGTTIVMAVHRSGILGLADKVMQIDHGRMTDFGPKSDVLSRLGMGGRQIELPVLKTSAPDLEDWIASQFTRDGDYGFSHKARSVGVELLQIACANCPPDTLRFSKFAFRFVDQTRCELTMFEAAASEVEDKIGRVKSKMKGGQGDLVHLTQDEVCLARVSAMSETFEVSSEGECTKYRVLLISDEDAADADWESQAL